MGSWVVLGSSRTGLSETDLVSVVYLSSTTQEVVGPWDRRRVTVSSVPIELKTRGFDSYWKGPKDQKVGHALYRDKINFKGTIPQEYIPSHKRQIYPMSLNFLPLPLFLDLF